MRGDLITGLAAAPAPAPAISARDALLRLAEDRMREFLAAERARWHRADRRASAVIDAVADLVNAGGKRLRPAFCLTGYLAGGGDPDAAGRASAVPAAIALELLHACALIHDDVMDASPLRRGKPTVHARHAHQHAKRRWLGDPGRFGESVAILAGDLALVYADQFMARAPAAVTGIWAGLRSELVIGQYLDLVAAARPTADPELSRWVALIKSGRYTVSGPLVIGAFIAGRPDLAPALESYGAAIGEAFQLRDDLLDLFGDGQVTGKPAGLDLARHKMTFLLSLAIRRDRRVRGLVAAAAGGDGAGLREVFAATGAADQVEAHIATLVEQGCAAIATARMDAAWRGELAAMARQVAYRDA